MIQHIKKKHSFTLIEIIIIISIIVILFGISIASYRHLNEIKGLEVQTDILVELIEFTKNKALSNDKSGITLIPTSVVSEGNDSIQSQRILSYTLSVVNSVITISITYCSDFTCDEAPVELEKTTSILRTYTLPNQFTFLSPVSISFTPLFGSMTDEKTLIMKNNNNNTCKKIVVNTSLVVSVSDITCI